MWTLKRSILISMWCIIILIISIGSFYTIKLFFEINKIKSEGIESVATIESIWRGKCGSGYGNSASFKLRIGDIDQEFISDCNVPNEVQVGDKYVVKYLKEDPAQNLVLFDKKVIKIK